MEPYKGFTYLVDALDLVRARGGHFKARIIGGGRDFERVRNRIDEKALTAHIELLGTLPFTEVKKHLDAADIFVAPSIMLDDGVGDGLPNVLIEAMAARTAIVASRVSGIPEAIKHGENGFLVDEKSAEALASPIHQLLNDRDLRERMGERGYQIAREAFDLRTNVRLLKEVILGRTADADRFRSALRG
jgi:glycosyltransferase involved in cell wall biosynthesis